MELIQGITVDPKVRFGKPVIAGTRVAVETVLGHLAVGDTIDTIAREYDLTRAQVLAAIQYATTVIAEEELVVA